MMSYSINGMDESCDFPWIYNVSNASRVSPWTGISRKSARLAGNRPAETDISVSFASNRARTANQAEITPATSGHASGEASDLEFSTPENTQIYNNPLAITEEEEEDGYPSWSSCFSWTS
jgi:hypothetical protein